MAAVCQPRCSRCCGDSLGYERARSKWGVPWREPGPGDGLTGPEPVRPSVRAKRRRSGNGFARRD